MIKWLMFLCFAFGVPLNGFSHVRSTIRKNPDFVGRSRELAELRMKLIDARRVAILGTAGIGKTEMAREYVKRWQTHYDCVFWFDPKGNIAARLKELAGHLGVPTGRRSLSMIVDSIKHQLDITNDRCLLVFDSMPDDPLQLSYLPSPSSRSHCHILITSRFEKLSHEEVTIELGALERKDSVALLAHTAGKYAPPSSQMKHLAEVLEDFPLALKQAGAFLAQTGLKAPQYKQILQNASPFDRADPEMFSQTLASVGLVSMQQIEKKHPVARQVLAISSFINGNDIPISLLKKMIHPKGVLDEVLGALSAFSLISLEEETFTVHRFFQRMVIANLSESERKSYLNSCLHFFNYHFNYSREQMQKGGELEDLYPHLKALLSRSWTRADEPALTASLLAKLGEYELCELDDYQGALTHLRSAMEMELELLSQKQNLQEGTWLSSTAPTSGLRLRQGVLHFSIGQALLKLNRLDEAKHHFNDSLRMLTQIEKERKEAHRPGKVGKHIASSLHGLARLAYEENDFQLSKSLFKQALAANKAFYNTEERFVIARDIHWLGCLCAREGDFNQAIDLFKRSLDIARKVFNTELPPFSGLTFCEMGEIFLQLSRFDEAEEFFYQAIRSEEKYHGSSGSPHCAAAHHALAKLHLYLGHFEEANKHLHEALLMRMILFGTEEHPKVADTLRLLGQLFLEKGDYLTARSYLDRVYRIHCESSACEFRLAETFVAMGHLATLQSHFGEAQKFYQRALSAQKRLYKSQPSQTSAAIELMLGHIHFELGNYDEATLYLKKAKKTSSRIFSTDEHLQVAHAWRGLAKIAVQKSEYKRAQGYYNQTLETYKSLYKTLDHPNIAELFLELAELSYKIGDYLEAAELCERAKQINYRVYENNETNLFLPEILNWKGRIAYRKGNFLEAKAALEESKRIIELHFPDKGAVARGVANHFLADVLWSLGQYEEAYKVGHLASKEFEQIYKKSAHSNVIDSNIALGKVCISLEKYDEAEALLTQTLKAANQLSSRVMDHRKSHAYFWLGSLEQALGHYKKAEAYFRKEYYILSAIHKETPNHPFIGMAYLKLADCLVHQNKAKAARYYYKQALEVQRENGFVFKHQAFIDKVGELRSSLNLDLKPE